MHKKSWTLNRVLSIIVYGVIACFVLGHATPTLAVRTKMLFHGYFRSCITAQIANSGQHTFTGAPIYTVSPSPVKYSNAAAKLAKHSILLPDRYDVTTFGLSFAQMSTLMSQDAK